MIGLLYGRLNNSLEGSAETHFHRAETLEGSAERHFQIIVPSQPYQKDTLSSSVAFLPQKSGKTGKILPLFSWRNLFYHFLFYHFFFDILMFGWIF